MFSNSRNPRNSNKRTVRGSSGKNISFQRAGRRRSPSGAPAKAALNTKAQILHQLKASKLTAQSIADKHKQQALKFANSAPAILSKKVSVAGLPSDVTEKSIREFFHNAVGGVRNIELYYNQYGKSTGNCMLTFLTFEQATALVKNYNGAPIDNGKSKLRLSLVVDTSRNAQPVALATRIAVPNDGRSKKAAAAPKEGRKNLKAIAAKKAKAAKKPVKKPKTAKQAKPTLASLDQEMNDYFGTPAPAPATN